MTPIEKLQEKLNIKIDESYEHRAYELEVSTYITADGYEVYVMNSTTGGKVSQPLDWENDVYYYQPSFDDIISRITELDAGSIIYIDDIEEYMPDYEIEQWINNDEDTDD